MKASWICVKVKLPMEYERVLIYYEGTVSVSAGYLSMDGSFYDAFTAWKLDDVSHWMSFPAPPTMRGEQV